MQTLQQALVVVRKGLQVASRRKLDMLLSRVSLLIALAMIVVQSKLARPLIADLSTRFFSEQLAAKDARTRYLKDQLDFLVPFALVISLEGVSKNILVDFILEKKEKLKEMQKVV